MVSIARRILSSLLFVGLLPASACQPELGECDPRLARQVAYDDATGFAAYEGQALIVASCGNGSFCHSAGIDGSDRYGAPLGLSFDVQLAAADGHVEVSSVVRQRRARFVVVQQAGAILESVQSLAMPPQAAPGTEIEEIYRGAPTYHRALDATPLPSIESEAGQEILRNWLACSAPVVERGAPRADGVDAVVEPPLDRPPVEPNWASIFDNLVGSPRCAGQRCHGGNVDAGFLALDASDTYRSLVGESAFGEVCAGQGVLIFAGDPEASLFFTKLNGMTECGERMPLNQIPLRSETLEAIETWIRCGAPEGPEACP